MVLTDVGSWVISIEIVKSHFKCVRFVTDQVMKDIPIVKPVAEKDRQYKETERKDQKISKPKDRDI
jgi:hypothetical protein